MLALPSVELNSPHLAAVQWNQQFWLVPHSLCLIPISGSQAPREVMKRGNEEEITGDQRWQSFQLHQYQRSARSTALLWTVDSSCVHVELRIHSHWDLYSTSEHGAFPPCKDDEHPQSHSITQISPILYLKPRKSSLFEKKQSIYGNNKAKLC